MAPSETAKSVDIGILELWHVQKFCQKFSFDVWRGTEHVIALFAVSTKVAGTSTTKSKIEKKHKASRPNRRQRLQKPLKLDSFEGANLDFSSMLP